jgi:valyl-tRNA synthetase
MNLEGVDDKAIDMTNLTIADRWILNKLNETAKLVNENIKTYRIGETAHVLYDFFWNQYCDWYVEIAKIQLQDEAQKTNTQRVLRYVLDMALRMLHPIMPHITEAIWQLIPQEKEAVGIIRAEYPTFKKEFVFEKENIEMELVFETIKSLRNVRQSLNIPLSTKMDIEIRPTEKEKPVFEAVVSYLQRLARVENVSFEKESAPVPPKSASAVVGNSKIIIPLEGLIDLDEEIARQNKKIEKLDKERMGLTGRLKNKNFVDKAPKELIEQTQARADELTAQVNAIQELIDNLK